ncbi:hypothetical protein F9C07_2278693 [Aspergillus flavus]|uniref:Uncharacterized protein n=1 Tax=Aspergillus flavus (strain ATCC 200026 / FGSC A1120 / IAM 13836 / NRRL 3357 / JCM 12722 / SRRC 167) TaxID=332952 RepID=A0A7U2QWH8_ASPFN|nr:hypothetical protein F9C07_2278693 [Aspergillus flavus]
MNNQGITMTHTGTGTRGDFIMTEQSFPWIFAAGKLTKAELAASHVSLILNKFPAHEEGHHVTGLKGMILNEAVTHPDTEKMYILMWEIRIDWDPQWGNHINCDIYRPKSTERLHIQSTQRTSISGFYRDKQELDTYVGGWDPQYYVWPSDTWEVIEQKKAIQQQYAERLKMIWLSDLMD